MLAAIDGRILRDKIVCRARELFGTHTVEPTQAKQTETEMNSLKIIAALFAVASISACSTYSARSTVPVLISENVLTDSHGMTLYTFDKDPAGSGKSVCNGPCAGNWPPLFATDTDATNGDYSTVVRDDGKKQWAFKGKPLYLWVKDQKQGDKTGDGFNNVWHIAKP
jgi:predicted lipoprotein with Yx(FWY)xxD motif